MYPGHCRDRTIDADRVTERLSLDAKRGIPGSETALRARLQGSVSFVDAVQGPQTVCLDNEVGDVVVHRRDAVVAYPLAAAVDDATDNDDVVRGADLLPATAAQIALMERLDLVPPDYAHVPVLVDCTGAKLGKQTGAEAIDAPLPALKQAWQVLGQAPLKATTVETFHALAHEQWQTDWIPATLARSLSP